MRDFFIASKPSLLCIAGLLIRSWCRETTLTPVFSLKINLLFILMLSNPSSPLLSSFFYFFKRLKLLILTADLVLFDICSRGGKKGGRKQTAWPTRCDSKKEKWVEKKGKFKKKNAFDSLSSNSASHSDIFFPGILRHLNNITEIFHSLSAVVIEESQSVFIVAPS